MRSWGGVEGVWSGRPAGAGLVHPFAVRALSEIGIQVADGRNWDLTNRALYRINTM
jgi:hypothetical protein